MKRRKGTRISVTRLRSLSSVNLWVEYKGLPDDRDHQIEKLVGRNRAGSGYCFEDGMRDLNFEFATVHGAQGAGKRVKSALGRKVKVSIR
jgi:hypothetical protein